MKTRRFLAALLCLAMIVTSGVFSGPVYAQEVQETLASAEQQDPGTQDLTDGQGLGEEDQQGQGQEGQLVEEQDPEEQKDEEQGDEGQNQEEQKIEENEGDPVEGEAEVPEETEEDAEEELELVLDGEVEIEQELQDLNAEEPYELEADGKTLKIKNDASIKSTTAVLPENTEIIPAGIFDEGSPAQTVKKIDFRNCKLTFTTINAHAFKGSALETLALPEGVTTIAEGAFQNCNALTQISGTTQLTEIGKDAFMDSGLTGIIIPNVKKIGENAFRDCSNLVEVELKKATEIGASAFRGCGKLNAGMTWSPVLKKIGARAFYGCGFTSLDLTVLAPMSNDDPPVPLDIEMGSYVFSNNANLVTVILPKQLKEIPVYAFENCKKLSNFNMDAYNNGDENRTSAVLAHAFYNCSALKQIKLGNHIKRIDENAFAGCSSLLNIDLYYDGDDPIQIAESAFPERSDRKNAFMRSYDETVEAYADRRGYTYQLLGTHKITKYATKYGTISAPGNAAAKGKTVRLTVTPEKGYSLKWGTLTVTKTDGTPVALTLDNFTTAKQEFTFTMPDDDVKIGANFVETSKAITGDLIIRANNSIPPEGVITIDKVGQTVQLSAADSAGAGTLGLWNFTFSSSNTRIMTVSSMGVITALKEGTAELTVTPTGMKNKAKKFKVKVDDEAVVGDIDFEPYLTENAVVIDPTETAPRRFRNPKIPNATVYPVNYAGAYALGDSEYYVVEYDKSTVDANAQTFSPSFVAEDRDTVEHLITTAKWTTSDAAVAKLSATSTVNNTVTVTVPKGANGVSVVKATVINNDPLNPESEAGIIVRVRDRTPRLSGNVSVNRNNPLGAKLSLTTVYGTKIDSSTGLKVCTKSVNSKNGHVEYIESKDLSTRYVDDGHNEDVGTYYVVASKTAAAKTYKNQLYLVGQFTDNGHYFYTPIPQLTVTGTAVKPKLSYTSKINLFYNYKAYNYVKVTHGVSGVEIDYAKTELISEANYPYVTGTDDLRDNFRIVTADNAHEAEDKKVVSDKNTIVIKLNNLLADDNSDLKKLNNQTVVKGYLKLCFVGFDEPFYCPITIPVVNTAPSYTFASKSGSASPLYSAPKFELRLVDSKKKVLELYKHADDYRKKDGTIDYDAEAADGKPADADTLIKYLKYNDGQTTDGLFNKSEAGLKAVSKKDQITIQLAAGRTVNAGTAAVDLRLETWSKPLTYKFSVSAAKAPTGSFKALTLNKQITSASGIAELKFSQNNLTCNGYKVLTEEEKAKLKYATFDIEDELHNPAATLIYTGRQTVANIANAGKVADLASVGADQKITFTLPNKGTAAWDALVTGTYSFQVIPQAQFAGSAQFELANVGLSVSVVNKTPALKLTTAKYTLNPKYAGAGEGVTTKTTLSNLPAGYTYKIPVTQDILEFWDAKGKALANPVYGVIQGAEIPAPTKDDPNRTLQTGIRAELAAGTPDKNATYSYMLKELKIEIFKADANGDPTGAALGTLYADGLVVSFVCKTAYPSLKTSSKGTINQIDSESAVTYTFTTNGIANGTITDVKLQELMQNNQFQPAAASATTTHFKVEQATDKDGNAIRNSWCIKLNPANIVGADPVVYNRKYTLMLHYTLDETGATHTQRITVTPTQSLAGMKLIDTKAMTYVGAKDRDLKVFVQQTSMPGALINREDLNVPDMGMVAGIRINPAASKSIKEAFSIKAVSKQYVDAKDEWYYDETTKEFKQLTQDDVDAGKTFRALKLDNAGKPVKDSKGNPIYGFYVTVELVHPGTLAANKTYTVPIEIRYQKQNVNTKGNSLNLSVTLNK